MENSDHSKVGSFSFSTRECSAPTGKYITGEGSVEANTIAIYARITALMKQFSDVATEKKIESASYQVLLNQFALMPLGFRIPDDVYLDGDGRWCCDWYDEQSAKGLYTCLTAERRLLVIADFDDGRKLRLPCDLDSADPLAEFNFGYMQLFGSAND